MYVFITNASIFMSLRDAFAIPPLIALSSKSLVDGLYRYYKLKQTIFDLSLRPGRVDITGEVLPIYLHFSTHFKK